MRVLAFTGSVNNQFDAIFDMLRRDWTITVVAPDSGPPLQADVITYPRPSVVANTRAERAQAHFEAIASAAKSAALNIKDPPDLIFGQASFGCLGYLHDVFSCPIVAHVELPGLEYAMSRPNYPIASDTAETDEVVRSQVANSLAQADAIITPTRYSRSLLPETLRRKCMPVMEGFSTRSDLPPAAKQRLLRDIGLDPGRPTIGFFARTLELIRGFDRFLAAARRLAKERTDLQVLIVGEPVTVYGADPDSARSGQSVAARLLNELPGSIKPRVHCTGFVAQSDLYALMGAVTVAVYPIYEGAGTWGVFEALAGGTPIVASNRAFLPEVIEHGVSGLLVDPDSEDALTGAISWVLDTPEMASKLGANGRSVVARAYSIEAAAQGYTAVFENTLSAYRSGKHWVPDP